MVIQSFIVYDKVFSLGQKVGARSASITTTGTPVLVDTLIPITKTRRNHKSLSGDQLDTEKISPNKKEGMSGTKIK